MNKRRPLLLILLVVYVFTPTLIEWITDPHGDWYRPFIIWLVIIAGAFALQSWRKFYDL